MKKEELDRNLRITDIYSASLAKRWDPYSRAERLNKVHSIATNPDITDDGLRKYLDFFERKFTESLKIDDVEEERIEQNVSKRNLFNYKYLPHSSKLTGKNIAPNFDAKLEYSGEYLLNCLQISEIAKRRKFIRSSYRWAYYNKQIRSNTFWIENDFVQQKSKVLNTFLPAYYIEDRLNDDDIKMVPSGRWRLSSELTTEIFSTITDLLSFENLFEFKGMLKSKPLNRSLDFGNDEELETLINLITHEIIENAMSHGIASSINPHANTNPNFDWGALMYMQTTTINFTSNEISNANSMLPRAFTEYDKISRKKSRKKSIHYSIFSFYDSGTGVLDHYNKFSESNSEYKKIADLVKGLGTTRGIVGSGVGFANIIKFTKFANAFLSIDTNSESYSFNGTNGVEESDVGRLSRGTLINLILPT